MQEDGEVFADRGEALFDHLLRRRPHDDPVAVGDRQAQQGVAHRTADKVSFHRNSLLKIVTGMMAPQFSFSAAWSGVP